MLISVLVEGHLLIKQLLLVVYKLTVCVYILYFNRVFKDNIITHFTASFIAVSSV